MIWAPRIFYLLVFFLLSIDPSFSQRINFDQLKKEVIEAQNQKEKAQAMMMLGSSFSSKETDQIFSYADSILLLSESGDEDFYKNASTYLTAVGHYKKGELIKAKSFFKKSLHYFFSQKGETSMKCLNFIGIIHLRTNQLDSAITVFNQIISDSNDNQAKLRAHGNIGSAYRKLGNYAKAINNFEKCVAIDPSNEFSILNSYLNVASMYAEMEFFEQGIETLRQIDITNISPQPIKAAYFNNLGELFFKNNEYDSAKIYLNQGLELAKTINQPQQTLTNRLILSEIFLLEENFEKASNLLSGVQDDLKYYPSPPTIIDFNLKQASFFNITKEYDSVILYAKKVVTITQDNNLWQKKENSYELIASAFEKKGNNDSSTFYYKKHLAFKDSLAISDKQKFAQDAKGRYLLAQNKNESNELKFWQKGLIGLLFLFLVFVSFIYANFMKSKKEIAKQVVQNQSLHKEIEKNKNELVELKSRAILSIDDIVSIKADGHYLEFNLVNKPTPEVDRNQIKSILSSLPSKFVQIHRSYVVNLDHVKIKQATKVTLKDGTELPVSRTFKEALAEAMNIIK